MDPVRESGLVWTPRDPVHVVDLSTVVDEADGIDSV